MAFSAVTERGSNTSTTSGTTVACTATANITVGKFAVVVSAWDNVSLTDGTSSDLSVADAQLNTWTKVAERTNTAAGVASDGVTGAMWFSTLTTQISSGDAVTVTCGSAAGHKTVQIFEVTIGAGNTVELVNFGESITDGSGGSKSVTVTGLSSGTEHLLTLLQCHERTLATAFTASDSTQDADYTSLSAIGTAAGGAASGMSHRVGTRIASGLTSETATTDLVPTGQIVFFLAAFKEVSSGNATASPAAFTPTLSLGTPGSGSDLDTLLPNGDGTVTNINSTDVTFSTEVDDLPGSAGSDYLYNDTLDGSVLLTLENMPADFASMRHIQFFYEVDTNNFAGDTCVLYGSVTASDETTAYTDEVQLATQTTAAGTYSIVVPINATGLAASKTDWDGARLKLRWDYTA